jgi:hypothetical protein
MAGSRYSLTEGAVSLLYLERLCATFHVPFTDLSLENITAPNQFSSNYSSQQDQLFGIIRPLLSQDKPDGTLYLHPEQECNSCSRPKMAPIRSYMYPRPRFTEVML